MRRPFHHRAWILSLLAVAGGSTRGADVSPEVVAEFTRRVQPLLLNACAAGACHGGPEAPAPQLARSLGPTRIDRRITLANLDAFLAAVGTRRDPQPLVELLSRRHPASAPAGGFTARPLTIHQRKTFEAWLQAVRESDPAGRFDRNAAPVVQASATGPVSPPNRFQALLDAAANPVPLPPPQEPQGIILGPIEREATDAP